MGPSSLRRLAPWALLALAGSALMAWMGLQGFAFSDYDREAAPVLARGLGRGTAAMVLLLCAANPITWRAFEMGHPEELLGGVLCVGAVLAATGRRPGCAGLLLGLAIANKAWAV